MALFDRVLAANILEDGNHDWAPPYLLAFGISVLLAILTALFFKPAPRAH